MQAQELAAAIGLDPTVVSNIERGLRAVKTSELSRIAKALSVSPLAILDEDSLLTRMPVVARSQGLSVIESDVYQRLTALAELHEVLARGGIPSNPKLDDLPRVDAKRWKRAADDLTSWVFERIELSPDQTDRLAELIRAIERVLGIDVMIAPSREEDFFGAAITDSEFPFIFIESSQPRTRAIFTLAHELGHVLARDGLPCTVDRDQSHDPLDDRERLSNAFAASLLMPEVEVRQILDAGSRSAAAVAKMIATFGVSFESLVWRMYNLRLIGAPGRDNLHAAGWGRLMQDMNDPDGSLAAQLMWIRRTPVEPHPPYLLCARLWTGFLRGVTSIRPLAGLLGEDADELLSSVESEELGTWDEALFGRPVGKSDETLS